MQVPGVLSSALAAPQGSFTAAHVVYLTCLAPAHDQTEGLQHVHDELIAKGYAANPYCVLALSTEPKRVLVRQVGSASTSVPHLGIQAGPQLVQESPDAETDPRPLYYLPWMPESEPEPSDYNQRAFADRVLASATRVIGRTRPPGEATVLFEEVLVEATHSHVRLWRNKNTKAKLVDATRELVRKVLRKAVPEIQIQSVPGQPSPGLVIKLPDDKIRKRLVKGLRQWRDDQWLREVQLQFDLEAATPQTAGPQQGPAS